MEVECRSSSIQKNISPSKNDDVLKKQCSDQSSLNKDKQVVKPCNESKLPPSYDQATSKHSCRKQTGDPEWLRRPTSVIL